MRKEGTDRDPPLRIQTDLGTLILRLLFVSLGRLFRPGMRDVRAIRVTNTWATSKPEGGGGGGRILSPDE